MDIRIFYFQFTVILEAVVCGAVELYCIIMAMPHCYLLGISVYYVHLFYVGLSNKLSTVCI